MRPKTRTHTNEKHKHIHEQWKDREWNEENQHRYRFLPHKYLILQIETFDKQHLTLFLFHFFSLHIFVFIQNWNARQCVILNENISNTLDTKPYDVRMHVRVRAYNTETNSHIRHTPINNSQTQTHTKRSNTIRKRAEDSWGTDETWQCAEDLHEQKKKIFLLNFLDNGVMCEQSYSHCMDSTR